MSHRILIKGGFVLSMDPHVGDLAAGDVLIEDGRIAAIAPAIDADAERVDATGTIVLPGFVDTHRHLWNTTLRGYLPECTVAVYGAGRGNVDSVFAAGRPVKRHGVLLGTDLARLRSRAEDSRDYILGRTGQLPAWLPSPAPR